MDSRVELVLLRTHEKAKIMTDFPTERRTLLSLTSDIVAAYTGHNAMPSDDLPSLITTVFHTVSDLGAPAPEPTAEPAVPRNKSITKKALICLECGKENKMLKRHLSSAHGLTPQAYRAKWGLAPSYPMVSPDYSVVRRELAKEIGLGHLPRKRGGARAKK